MEDIYKGKGESMKIIYVIAKWALFVTGVAILLIGGYALNDEDVLGFAKLTALFGISLLMISNMM